MTQQIKPEPNFTPEEIGKHCLVTGGAGYLGSHIVRRLVAAGCKVRSLDVIEHQHDGDVECVVGDLRDYDAIRSACEGINTVYHSAAIINIMEIARPSVRRFVHDVNVTGTDNILRAAADAGVATFVQTSTFSVVLDRVLEDKDESVPYATRTNDLYATTKILAEKAVLAADDPQGMRTCAMRPGGLWGSDTNCIMIRSILEQIAKGNFKALIGDGKATMDNTHVENLVDAHLLAARALRQTPDKVGGEAYFIFDDEHYNALEWFRPLVEGLGEKFPTFRLPGVMMREVARGLEFIHFMGGPEPTLTRRGIRNMLESSSFRIDKARRDLGYEPRYNRENGIPELLPIARDYVDALRKQKSGAGSTQAVL